MLIRSEKQLEALGAHIARRILTQSTIYHLPSTVLALSGELGAGKTTFLRGFARGLGIKSRITSPTFVLARRHRMPKVRSQESGARRGTKKTIGSVLRTPPFQYFWHIDAYRLRNEQDLGSIDFKDIVSDSHNIVAVEWADRIKKAMPKGTIWIRFAHHRKGRVIQVPKRMSNAQYLISN